jgi:TonB-linked SusC/RagA family outer membrane protein
MNQTLRSLTTAGILLLCFLLPQIVMAQNVSVKGSIKNAKGEGVPSATVSLKGSAGVATATDADGNFTLALKSGTTGGTLEITSVGYAKKEVPFTANSSSIIIVLDESVSSLADVVLTGYLKQKKSDITGAISSIRNKDFKDQPVSNLAQSIEGKVSGILVTTPSGTPGAGLLVSIRGSNNPLYVVDGIPMLSQSNSSLSTSYTTDGSTTGSGQNISSISDINPDDIESIEILKDASAASIYGARAANGVVLITTKRGKNGKTDFTFDSYTGLQQVSHNIPFLTSTQLVDLELDAQKQDIDLYQNHTALFDSLINANGVTDFIPAMLTKALPASWHTGVNTNWLDQVLRTAPITNIELSARGGNDKTKFFISGDYFDQQGIVINNYYKRGSFRVNVDNKVSNKVSIGAGLSFTYGRDRRSFNDDTYTGIVTNAIGASPLMPVYNKDGTYADYTQYQALWLSDNPVKSANEVVPFTTNYRLVGNVFTDIDLLKNLKLHSSFSTDYTNLTDDQYFDATTSDGSAVNGKAFKDFYTNLTWVQENTLTYQNTFAKDNNLTVLGGFSTQFSKPYSYGLEGTGFPSGADLDDISNAVSIFKIPINPFSNVPQGIVSYFGRVVYSYKEKYLLSLNAREDGSSLFAPQNRWGFFPGMSAGWILTKEKFLDHSNWLTNLKLRFSYGELGDLSSNTALQYQTNWTPASYNGQVGLRPYNLGNPDITWQRNKMVNAGVDFEILGGKISGSIEVYKGNQTKLLAEAPLPTTSGFPSYTVNYGNVENKGVELGISAYPVKNKNFTWTTSFNISYAKNTILSLYTNDQLLSAYNDLFPTHILEVGQAVGSFYGYKFLGINPQTGIPSYSANEQVLGKATPNFFGGWSNDLRYKNWDLNIATQFSFGNEVYNLIQGEYLTGGYADDGFGAGGQLLQIYANNATIVNTRWEKPGDASNLPRASLLFDNYMQSSSQFVDNASFVKVKTVNLSYTLRPKTAKVYSSLRLYLQVQNLLTITKYYGFDPEVSSNGGSSPETAGVDYAAYPQARVFMFGVTFSF